MYRWEGESSPTVLFCLPNSDKNRGVTQSALTEELSSGLSFRNEHEWGRDPGHERNKVSFAHVAPGSVK